MSFKDYFYFTNTERRGVLVLLVVMTLLVVYIFFSKQLVASPDPDPEVMAELQSNFQEYSNEPEEGEPKLESEADLFEFDPNQIGADEWTALGLSEKQAGSILKYVEKGGRFRSPEDLKKMYVISEEFYARVEPFIRIEKEAKPSAPKEKKLIVEINGASADELKRVKGIGDKLSARIIKYRDLLGGFVSKEQLTEVYGLRQESYDAIIDQVSVDPASAIRINVNSFEDKELWQHPYVRDWDLVNLIKKEHRAFGRYSSLEEFQSRVGMSDSLFVLLSPYLTVGE